MFLRSYCGLCKKSIGVDRDRQNDDRNRKSDIDEAFDVSEGGHDIRKSENPKALRMKDGENIVWNTWKEAS